jgi:hypothetical protein
VYDFCLAWHAKLYFVPKRLTSFGKWFLTTKYNGSLSGPSDVISIAPNVVSLCNLDDNRTILFQQTLVNPLVDILLASLAPHSL